LPNKRTRQTPRKSSTNTSALSTEIKNLRKEMNPYASIKGGTAIGISPAMYIDRVTQSEFAMINKSLPVTAGLLAGMIPDGAKILGMKMHNINGRKLAVTIPPTSGLLVTTGNSLTAPTIQMQKVAYAPLSVFPKLKVEIPDLVATSIDTTAGTTTALFNLATDGASDVVVVRFHYKQAI